MINTSNFQVPYIILIENEIINFQINLMSHDTANMSPKGF